MEAFLEKANQVHNNKYDYSKVDYKGCFQPICIICPEHGEFWQTPAGHLNKRGCPKCGVESSSKQRRKTLEWFIENANRVHNNKYNYSKVDFKTTKDKVCIICPEHGEFWQAPYKHIYGKQDCPLCVKQKIWDSRGRITTNDFIAKANIIFNNKYDYSKVDYKRNDRKVCIICPEHGEFWQTPQHHLQGQECPECNKRNNKNECQLWRKLQDRYQNLEIIHEYHNNEILGLQSFDIFIPALKVAIEYQGGQHFKPLKNFGGYASFIKTAQRDKAKYEKCKKNGIKLLYYTNETWNVTPNYLDVVYTKFDDLCIEIDKLFNN